MPILPFLSADPAILTAATTFLFVFAIVFALLSFTKIFVKKDKEGEPLPKEKEPRGVYAVLSLVFAVSAASYEPLSVFLQQVMPPVIILLVIIFIFVFIKEIFRKKKDKVPHPMQDLAVLAISLILLGAFWPEITSLLGLGGFLGTIGPDNIFVLLIVVLVVGIFYIASKVGEPEPEKKV